MSTPEMPQLACNTAGVSGPHMRNSAMKRGTRKVIPIPPYVAASVNRILRPYLRAKPLWKLSRCACSLSWVVLTTTCSTF